MVFRRKKKKELADLGLGEEEIIDFKEFEEFEEEVKKRKDLKPEDLEKNFVFHISNGCPVCGSDVKGNDHYRYFCENCNVLFDKKDIIEKEFGKTITETGPVRKTRLTDDERAELEKKRKELKDRIYKTFTKQVKKELVKEAEEKKVEEEAETAEKEEETLETVEPPSVERIIEALPEEGTEEEPEEIVMPEEAKPKKEEYGLESQDKIIASSQSNKMHTGNCHFVRKIHPQNRIYLNSTEEGGEQGYEMCVCLRRLKAMQR